MCKIAEKNLEQQQDQEELKKVFKELREACDSMKYVLDNFTHLNIK